MREQIAQFGFTPAAADFLGMLWDLIQFFDDVYDKDETPKDIIYTAVFDSLVNFPLNAFYRQHSAALAPALVLMIEKWRVSNVLEESKMGDARTYMWRAAFYDVFALVCILEGKPVDRALNLYGEKYEDYLQEVNYA